MVVTTLKLSVLSSKSKNISNIHTSVDLVKFKNNVEKYLWPFLPKISPNLVSVLSVPLNLLASYLLYIGNNLFGFFPVS